MGRDVGFEPGLSEFREMERSHSEGVGGLAALVHETQPPPVFDLQAASGLLIMKPFPLA